MPSLQFYHNGLAMENYCSARSYATRCSDYNTFYIPRQAMSSANVVDDSRQSHNWLADSEKVNDRRRSSEIYIQDKQDDLFPINQGQITSTTAKQRSSVIKWARKDVPFKTAGYNQIPSVHEQSLQTMNVKYQEKFLESILYKEKDLSSGKTFTQNAFPSNKTDVFQPCSSNTKKYKYNCRFCSKPFQWYSHWQAHERIHTGERPYSCDECGKAFTRSDGLQSHKITHLNKMNYRSPEEKTKITDETKRVENKLIPYDEFVGEVNDEEMFGPNVIRDNDKNLFHCRFCKRVLFSSAQFLKHVHRHKGIYHIFSLNFLSFYFILKDNCNT